MSHLLRMAARALTGVSYAYFGYETIQKPRPRVKMAAPALAKAREIAPLPVDDETLVRINGAVQVGSGALLTMGVLPRLSAAALIGSLVPTTVAGHPFWQLEDPAARTMQLMQFMKNTAMIGGLVALVATPAD
ncbi:DoxX family protein [Aldersonia kunmingensis]|uniref:DoxX family protein n=1 Tax=Aldersonia kunmingensis TaxID=408066 RepID=UPI000837A09E|nr:DoxX family protein [Aldersonia kunmingensis]